jgi:hypothetical protein
MKRKNSPTKLKLNRQTIRSLNDDALGGVNGGANAKSQIVCSASGVCICPSEDCDLLQPRPGQPINPF